MDSPAAHRWRVWAALAVVASAVAVTGLLVWAPWSGGSTRGLTVTSIKVGHGPVGVVEGAGSIWVANNAGATVSRIDPATNATIGQPIRVGSRRSYPTSVAFAAGIVWVTNGFDRTVSRIDPATNATIGQPIPLPDSGQGMTVGAGSVWVSAYDLNSTRGQLVRIDPATGNTTRIPVPYMLGQLAFGAGSIWSETNDGKVLRIDPATGTVIKTFPGGPAQFDIAFGAGSAWVSRQGDDTIERIDAASGTTTVIHVGHMPRFLSVGAGSVWVANYHDDAVWRIDPTTGKTIEVVHTRSFFDPGAVAFGSGSVWVTDYVGGYGHTLVRVKVTR